MHIDLTEVQKDDLKQLNDLINEEDIVRYLDYIPPVTLQKTIDFYEFMKFRNGLWWCIRADGEMIGSIGIIPAAPNTKMSHSGNMFVYITRKFWGRQIGRMSLEYALAAAGKAGMERIEVLVVDVNSRAVRLYEKHGFVTEGVMRRAFKIEDNYHDIHFLSLLI